MITPDTTELPPVAPAIDSMDVPVTSLVHQQGQLLQQDQGGTNMQVDDEEAVVSPWQGIGQSLALPQQARPSRLASVFNQPEFKLDHAGDSDKVCRCARVFDFGYHAWCGLRCNIRNTKRFFSWQMLATILFSFTCVIFNCYMQVKVQAQSESFNDLPIKYNFTQEDRDRFTTLPDIGFEYLPHIVNAHLADYLVMSLVAFTHLRFMFTPMGASIERRWCFHVGLLFAMRGIAISATLLPNPLKECHTTALDYRSAFYAAILIMAAQIVTCADVLFSGHTVNVVLAGLVWHTYSHKAGVKLFDTQLDPCGALFCPGVTVENKAGHIVRASTVKVLIWIWVAVAMFTIVATRFHYTIDVFVGFMMALFTWNFYHTYVRTIYVDNEKPFNRLIMWLERDIEEFSVDHLLAQHNIQFLNRRTKRRTKQTVHRQGDVERHELV